MKYYHAEPAASSLKSMMPLIEKRIEFQSGYVDLHKFEQHSDWLVAANPEGQVPVIDHDGHRITHTTLIYEFLEDVFPAISLRSREPVGMARMGYWNKFVEEQGMNYTSMHGRHGVVGVIARNIELGEFERLMGKIPLPDQRKKWKTALSGFSDADLAYAIEKAVYAIDKVEKQLTQTGWLAGDDCTLADININAMCGMMVERMFRELAVASRCPRIVAWRERVTTRPAVARALAGEDRTAPALRTLTGHAR